MRLDKYLADMNVGKRSTLKKEIRSGMVCVGGRTERDPACQVAETDAVFYRGERVIYETYEYYMMNKPAGVVSATEDQNQTTVLDLLTGRIRKGIFPVGRLDIDTEGLLLLTNDGQLSHRLLSPKRHVDKTYLALVTGEVTDKEVRKFAAGLRVDRELTALPAKLDVIWTGRKECCPAASDRRDADIIPEYHLSAACIPEEDVPAEQVLSEVKVTIHEGKFHQIKRMFHSVEKEVLYLKRISMGPLSLDRTLKPGEYRRLTDKELQLLKETE